MPAHFLGRSYPRNGASLFCGVILAQVLESCRHVAELSHSILGLTCGSCRAASCLIGQSVVTVVCAELCSIPRSTQETPAIQFGLSKSSCSEPCGGGRRLVPWNNHVTPICPFAKPKWNFFFFSNIFCLYIYICKLYQVMPSQQNPFLSTMDCISPRHT